MHTADVEAQLAILEGLDLHGLRDAWPARLGSAPRTRSPDHLRRLLAWKLQEEVFGGLDPETRRLLAKKATAPKGPATAPGVRLARQWKGERHEVEITDDDRVFYRGTVYASLSEVAREITGSRWNGPRFFGLRGAA